MVGCMGKVQIVRVYNHWKLFRPLGGAMLGTADMGRPGGLPKEGDDSGTQCAQDCTLQSSKKLKGEYPKPSPSWGTSAGARRDHMCDPGVTFSTQGTLV